MLSKRPMNMSFYPSKSSLQTELKACWIYVFFGSLLSSRQSLGFSLETLHPKVFTAPQGDSHFGHRVCHFDPTQADSVLVTAPYLDNGSGGIYSCSYSTNQCSRLHLKVDSGIALGLSLACDDHQAIVCGPRYEHKCEGFNYLNGLCVEISPRHTNTIIKPAFQECHVIPPLDAVILFDDSGSITAENFQTMIKFIKTLIAMFLDTRAQVAVAKFSTKVSAVFHFENFAVNRDPDQLMKDVTQEQGHTYTPSAIRFVLEEMFSVKVGMRSNSQKLLLVITDGKSNDPGEQFNNVILLANKLGITRFAVGIGKEYLLSELELIASSPQFVFETESFSALTSILNQLKEKIFSIEGTDTGNFSSFQMELSQGGFSVALSEGSRVFGAVGAYSWSGGIVQDLSHQLLNSSFINATNMEEDIKNSYLGYSVAVATVDGNVVYFAGAPRHRHTGIVLGFTQNHQNHTWTVSQRIYGSQLGSYFGAELCVLSASGLLAVGAPLYHTQGVGGEVRICPLHTGTLNCSAFLRGVRGNEFGRFGTSLAAVQDLNGDGFMELAVGAPQEQGKGAIYIFLGRPGGIRTEYSQRVSGAEMGSGLQYFGVSLHSAGDLTADALIDVVVGSKGDVTVLRTQPVMCLPVNITVDLPIIPQHFFHCSAPFGLNTPVDTVTICVSIKEIVKGNIQGPFSAAVSLALELDPPAKTPRLLFGNRSASFLWTSRSNLSSLSPVCTAQPIIIPECISDYHEVPLSGRLNVTGAIIPETGGLRPVLSPDCHPTFTEMVILEKVCGEDHVCISDLNVSLSFLSDTVVSTVGYPVNLSVVVYNNGEDSTDTELFLYHPTILSFAWVKASIGQVWCESNQTELSNVTRTTCQLGATVFRQRVKTTLMMLFTVATPLAVNEHLIVNALVTSKNENNNTVQDNRAANFVVLKLPVNVVVKDGGSTRFVKYPDSTQLEHIYTVENTGKLSAPVNISFVFPVEMTFPEINGTGTTCEKQVLLKHGERFNLTQHCSVSTCHLIGCTIKLLTSNQPITFKFTGTISSGKQVSIMSWGFLFFDSERYIQYPLEDSHQLSIVTELEVPSQALTVLITSLSIFFGLIIMAVIFVMLYKRGFFNSTSTADQNHPAEPSTGEAVNSDQTSADAPVESAQSNGQSGQITEERSIL
ncbi:integrin alpha-X-like isoform X1 [Triplophysa rosa]|uniref:integrin alpha-X-like isoform X1 n=1 Tax=Triplophysa rosa TaxID=992332 RepID=UPI002545D70C|nr:integrin alpha-X-like isoform X1 [Triplophysa rosa]